MSRVAFLMPTQPGSTHREYYVGVVERPEAVRVVRRVENPPVREALKAITKQSFGYNTEAWRRWWKNQQLAEAHRPRSTADGSSLSR